MMDAAYFRDKAERCRNIANIAMGSVVRAQLLAFADELDEKARELEAQCGGPAKQP